MYIPKFIRECLEEWFGNGSAAAAGAAVGAASSTDNAIARFDGTTGTVLQNSAVIIGDDGTLTLPTDIFVQATGNRLLAGGASTIFFGSLDLNRTVTFYANGSGLMRLLTNGNLATPYQFTIGATLGSEDVGIGRASEGRLKVTNAAAGSGDIEVGSLYLTDGTVKQVVVGASDSGGAGFKMLRVAN